MSTDPAPIEGQAETPPVEVSSPFGELNDDLKGYVENKGWKDTGAILESYRNLERLRGVPEERLLRLPEDPKDMGDVWNRLGRPETADGYTAVLGEDLRDGVYDRMSGAAHAAGLTDAQWQSLQTEFAAAAGDVQQQQAEGYAAAFEEWKGAHAQDFQRVRNLMQAVGASQEDMAAAMNGDAAAFYGTLAKVAARMGEQPAADGFDDPGTAGGSFNISPQAAQQKIDSMMSDQKYLDRLYHNDPKVREAAAAEKRRYHEIVAKGKEAGPLSAHELQNENARLRAELRRRA